MIKNMHSKMTTNSQLSTTEPKKEQNHRNGDHMDGYQRGRDGARIGKTAQGIRSTEGRFKIDRGRVRIVWKMEKPENLDV